MFIHAFANRISYSDLVDFLFAVLPHEQDYLPWRVVYKHVVELESILQYKKSYFPMTQFIISTIGNLWNNLNSSTLSHTQRYDLWTKNKQRLFLSNFFLFPQDFFGRLSMNFSVWFRMRDFLKMSLLFGMPTQIR